MGPKGWLGIVFAISAIVLIAGVYGLALTVDSSGSGANLFSATLAVGIVASIISGVLLLVEIYADR